MYKVMLYCQLGGAIDMAEFAVKTAIKNSGLDKNEFDIIFICWKTPKTSYEWLKDNNFKYEDMVYDEGKGFLWNLYKGWNYGYEIGFKYADYVCPIATDHSFYKDWLKNLLAHCKENRIVNCKLIESPSIYATLHVAEDLGPTIADKFNQDAFEKIAESITQPGIAIDDIQGLYHENRGFGGTYGHRLDAMPFVVAKDVWERFGPMLQTENKYGTTGDTDFFDRCRNGGVEIVKALDAISYHGGKGETIRNMSKGNYT